MSQAGYLAIAISLVALLLGAFIVTFLLNRKTPAPAGTKKLTPSEEKCGGCSELGCPFYERFHQEEN